MEENNNCASQAIMRGVILGGSVGLIATWMGMPLQRGLLLGFLCGFLAGATKYAISKRKK